MTLRDMNHGDIPAGLTLCRAARWNQTERDWRFFLDRTTAGCLAADKDGRVVGTAATLDYGDAFSWIAMVLVDPKERGQGIGTALLETAVDRLRNRKSIRLDATPAGEQVYRPLGFQGEFPLARYERDFASAAGVAALPMREDDWRAVLQSDGESFGADRGVLLRWLAEGAPDLALFLDGGYCFGRRGHDFDHIGPVVAHDDATARELIESALARCRRRTVIDAPPRMEAWLMSMGFRKQRPFLRMCLGEVPVVNNGLMYAITGPEFA